jgi:hypothetical protein
MPRRPNAPRLSASARRASRRECLGKRLHHARPRRIHHAGGDRGGEGIRVVRVELQAGFHQLFCHRAAAPGEARYHVGQRGVGGGAVQLRHRHLDRRQVESILADLEAARGELAYDVAPHVPVEVRVGRLECEAYRLVLREAKVDQAQVVVQLCAPLRRRIEVMHRIARAGIEAAQGFVGPPRVVILEPGGAEQVFGIEIDGAAAVVEPVFAIDAFDRVAEPGPAVPDGQ